MGKKLVTATEAARFMGISRATVAKAVKSGQLQSFRIGGRLLIPVSRLNTIVGSQSEMGVVDA